MIIIIIIIYSNINFLLTEWFAAARGRWRMRAYSIQRGQGCCTAVQ